MLTFNKNYFGLTILFFVIETLIALFVHDSFVRPYLGDVFVVTIAIMVLLFAFVIEFLQLLNIVEKLHLEKSKIAKTVIGTSFSWIDILTYCIGIAIVIVVEKQYNKNNTVNENNTLQ
jgi:hypothetical protein